MNRLEELRFAKKQQWSIAAAGMTLLGAIFGAAHTMAPLGLWEKTIGAILALLVMFASNLQLFFLHGSVRLFLDGAPTA